MTFRKNPHIPLNTKVSTTNSLKITQNDYSIILSNGHEKKLKSLLKAHLHSWQLKTISEKNEVQFYDGKKGPLTIIHLSKAEQKNYQGHYQILTPSLFGKARDLMGQVISKYSPDNISKLNIFGLGLDEQSWAGCLTGLEMAPYHFVKNRSLKIQLFQFEKNPNTQKLIKKYIQLGQGVNLARYLVDLPPGDKRPGDYSEFLKDLFSEKANCKLTIWDQKKLSKEKMGMILAVGGASVQPPRLVHLRYRSPQAKGKKAYAFVGKGITFDSGGLDVKPPNGMRWMKKDMGGSASLAGLALWVVNQKLALNCDFYFALAENAIDAHAFRPGDVITSRKGLKVEIDNTDAEGRLVLGDALTVATEDKPEFVIDVATLTGAIKVALGAETAGLFSNNDALADKLLNSATHAGEAIWRMPLLKEQRELLSSQVGDLTNSASGFGGAVRAAMFLNEFVGNVPWAHFDIYSWIDSPRGAYLQNGGNGQLVQTLSFLLEELSEN